MVMTMNNAFAATIVTFVTCLACSASAGEPPGGSPAHEVLLRAQESRQISKFRKEFLECLWGHEVDAPTNGISANDRSAIMRRIGRP